MPSPQVLFAPETAACLMQGVDAVADLLALTLGPLPGTVFDQAHEGYRPEALADAPTIARRITSLGDREADVAAMLLRNLVWQAEETVGDGGATVAVLTQAMLHDAQRLVAAGAAPALLAEGIRLAPKQIDCALRRQSRPVQDETELARIAFTVTQDREMAALIGELLYVMGSDAIIEVEDHFGRILESRYYPNAMLQAPLANRLQMEGRNCNRLQMQECLVAAVDGELHESDDMLALLTAALYAQKSNLCVLARGFSETVLAWMALNTRKSDSPIAVMGANFAPLSSANDCPYEDIACLTGATVLALPHTKPVSHVQVADLGLAAHIETDLTQTCLTPEIWRMPAIREYARQLRQKRDRLPPDDPSMTWLRRRIGTMDLGTGEVRIGADTAVEREWKKRVVQRALRSVGHALYDGVVPGGGCSLVRAAGELNGLDDAPRDVQLGLACAVRALKAPAQRILTNAHHPAPSLVLEEMRHTSANLVYDVTCGEWVDAFGVGLADPVRVVREAFRIAASGAASALTIDTMVLRRNPPLMAKP